MKHVGSIPRLNSSFAEPVLLAIIGGSGLHQFDSLVPVAKLNIETPWGTPSGPITISRTASGFPIAFLARHGVNHQYTPTDIPARANIAALKRIGVRAIVSFSAVGSLQESIKPRDFSLPNQIIDRTKGLRPSSFFESGFAAHVAFGEPFDLELHNLIASFSNQQGLLDNGAAFHTKSSDEKDLVLVCIEGPAFSTRAESHIYRSWNGAVINMSVIPEAMLAKEAEIAYQMICMTTDCDAWKERAKTVTAEAVNNNLKANTANANKLITKLIPKLEEQLKFGAIGKTIQGSMKSAVATSRGGMNPELKSKLDWLHPNHWS